VDRAGGEHRRIAHLGWQAAPDRGLSQQPQSIATPADTQHALTESTVVDQPRVVGMARDQHRFALHLQARRVDGGVQSYGPIGRRPLALLHLGHGSTLGPEDGGLVSARSVTSDATPRQNRCRSDGWADKSLTRHSGTGLVGVSYRE